MRFFEDTPQQEKDRSDLVNSIRAKGISDERVLEVMNNIPRHYFMPEALLRDAYVDKAFPIGEGQTISQPYTVAYQTQLLDLKPHHRVLEIGTGSAYQAVLLAELVAEVFSIERQKKLFDRNQQFPYLKMFGNLHLFYGDGFDGLPEHAPFDRILITAAPTQVPKTLVAQLKVGGKMVLPLGAQGYQRMVRLTKVEDGPPVQEFSDMFSFVPMVEGRSE